MHKMDETDFCERCGSELVGKTMSWFTTEIICTYCSAWEEKIIDELDRDKNEVEGIGHIPDVENLDVEWGTKIPELRD